MKFLDHPVNVEFAFECAGVCFQLAIVEYEKNEKDKEGVDNRDIIWKILDMQKKLLDIVQKNANEGEQKIAYDNLEFQVDEFIFRKALWKEKADYPRLLKKLVAHEVKYGLAPEDYNKQLWDVFRKELKERGIKTRRNIEEVDDKIIWEHMITRGKDVWKNTKKRDDVKLKQILTKFFELNGNTVSHQKQKRIDKFIAGLTDDRAVGIQTVFGGALSKDKLKEWRKHFNEPDDLTPALDAMEADGSLAAYS